MRSKVEGRVERRREVTDRDIELERGTKNEERKKVNARMSHMSLGRTTLAAAIFRFQS